MANFSEKEYNLRINRFRFQITECTNEQEVFELKTQIKNYKNECKFKHFNWILEEDYNSLKKELNNKLNKLEYDRHKEIV